jgi:hypothetical protein
MKVKSADILKPGVILKVAIIDFNDPDIKKFVERSKLEQQKLLDQKRMTQKRCELLRRVITI